MKLKPAPPSRPPSMVLREEAMKGWVLARRILGETVHCWRRVREMVRDARCEQASRFVSPIIRTLIEPWPAKDGGLGPPNIQLGLGAPRCFSSSPHPSRETPAQIGVFPHRRPPQHPLASRPGHSSSPRSPWSPLARARYSLPPLDARSRPSPRLAHRPHAWTGIGGSQFLPSTERATPRPHRSLDLCVTGCEGYVLDAAKIMDPITLIVAIQITSAQQTHLRSDPFAT